MGLRRDALFQRCFKSFLALQNLGLKITSLNNFLIAMMASTEKVMEVQINK